VKEHQLKLRTSRGSPRHMRICTAKAAGISRRAAKSGCAREWGGWGRLSEDGPGQNNPDRSEGPWGRAEQPLARRCFPISPSLTQRRESRWPEGARRAMANQHAGKALSENPALKPYWGKPAVRNFRGGKGDVGIIRSPVRALALPDWNQAENRSGAIKFLPDWPDLPRRSDGTAPDTASAVATVPARNTIKTGETPPMGWRINTITFSKQNMLVINPLSPLWQVGGCRL